MGVDFIRKAAPSFRKGLDRRRLELGTPNLFTQHPIDAPRTYAATLRAGEALDTGEQVCVHLDDARHVLVLRGLDAIGEFDNPTADLLDALVDSHGEACGLVQTFHSIARIAEIIVC
jgi:hypothetical protein